MNETEMEGIDRDRLVAAAHELAHYLIFHEAGIRISEVRVSGRGDHASGYVAVDQSKFDGPQARALLIGTLAGRQGDLRWCDEMGWTHHPEYTCATDMRLYRKDYREIRKARHDLQVKGITDGQLRVEARRQVRRHWSRIVRLTPKLARRGSLHL
ncbi:MAG: hypothetical protein ACRDMV_18240 [Streptosporangiales bacterium]